MKCKGKNKNLSIFKKINSCIKFYYDLKTHKQKGIMLGVIT